MIQNKDLESESEESENDEERQARGGPNMRGGKGMRGGRGGMMKVMAGIPRKQFKRMIKKELDKQCSTIF